MIMEDIKVKKRGSSDASCMDLIDLFRNSTSVENGFVNTVLESSCTERYT